MVDYVTGAVAGTEADDRSELIRGSDCLRRERVGSGDSHPSDVDRRRSWIGDREQYWIGMSACFQRGSG